MRIRRRGMGKCNIGAESSVLKSLKSINRFEKSLNVIAFVYISPRIHGPMESGTLLFLGFASTRGQMSRMEGPQGHGSSARPIHTPTLLPEMLEES